MLLLSRKAGERILIASNIVVEVVEVRGNRVRLGITAPKDVKIVREEIKELKPLNREGVE